MYLQKAAPQHLGGNDMKRKNFAACALALALLVLAGCSNSASDSKPDTTPQATPAVDSGTAAANGKTVSPLPSGIDLQHLNDCTVAVSFDKGDAFVDGKGAMQLKVKVYAYDAFDTVDINKLQVGDQITICQQNVKVTSLERGENAAVLINGGADNGGYTLVSGEASGFYAVGPSDTKLYYALGEATIPVSSDLVFEDSSDLEKGTRTYYAGDFLTDGSGLTYHFVPDNTTITIEGGYVTHMQRVYTP